MPRITFKEVMTVFTAALLINIAFAAFLFAWVTDEDIEHLPQDSWNRFLTLFFFAVTSFTTIGFGEYGSVRVKSLRIKMIITIYILLAISGAASFFFNF